MPCLAALDRGARELVECFALNKRCGDPIGLGRTEVETIEDAVESSTGRVAGQVERYLLVSRTAHLKGASSAAVLSSVEAPPRLQFSTELRTRLCSSVGRHTHHSLPD